MRFNEDDFCNNRTVVALDKMVTFFEAFLPTPPPL